MEKSQDKLGKVSPEQSYSKKILNRFRELIGQEEMNTGSWPSRSCPIR